MRQALMSRFIFAIVFFFNLTCFSQINPQKLDSLTHAIDSTQKRVQAWQDSFNKKQDSLYRSGVNKANGESNLQKEPPDVRQLPIVLGILIVLSAFVVMLYVVKKKRKDSNSEKGSDGFNT
jgi:hypothetical protein